MPIRFWTMIIFTWLISSQEAWSAWKIIEASNSDWLGTIVTLDGPILDSNQDYVRLRETENKKKYTVKIHGPKKNLLDYLRDNTDSLVKTLEDMSTPRADEAWQKIEFIQLDPWQDRHYCYTDKPPVLIRQDATGASEVFFLNDRRVLEKTVLWAADEKELAWPAEVPWQKERKVLIRIDHSSLYIQLHPIPERTRLSTDDLAFLLRIKKCYRQARLVAASSDRE